MVRIHYRKELYHSHITGAGAYAGCAYCLHHGEYSKILQKIIYPGNRCFLQEDDILRNDSVNFPIKFPDNNDPPVLKQLHISMPPILIMMQLQEGGTNLYSPTKWVQRVLCFANASTP
jgi:hypothetical protein